MQVDREYIELLGEVRRLREDVSRNTARIDAMWSIYMVGRVMIPLLLALQPVMIVVGVWLIRELSS